jgi:hypothetical protein
MVYPEIVYNINIARREENETDGDLRFSDQQVQATN